MEIWQNIWFKTSNEKLFGSEDQQWNIEDATIFVNQLIKFWNEY